MAGRPENEYNKTTIKNVGMFSRSFRWALKLKQNQKMLFSIENFQ